MRKSFSPRPKHTIALLFIIFALLLAEWMPTRLYGRSAAEAKMTRERIPLDRSHPLIQAVMAIQKRDSAGLMAIPDVVGHATGLDETGLPAVRVFLRKKVGRGVIPESLEGVPVVRRVTGEMFAMCGGGSDPTKTGPSRSPTRSVRY